jgi:hypothetical protein
MLALDVAAINRLEELKEGRPYQSLQAQQLADEVFCHTLCAARKSTRDYEATLKDG